MKTRLLALWVALSGSYWFLPTIMALGALALSFITTDFDRRIDAQWLRENSWLFVNEPAGARTILSTVAGSMIGVAGVSFSITIASVVYASGQYGPRLLTNFMHDRGNQFTLGTFIATFLYCLMILRSVRSMEQVRDNVERELQSAFVPHTSLLIALTLAVLSIGVLIYFIHHVPESIHVSNVISDVGRELSKKLETLFPEEIGLGADERDRRRAEEEIDDAGILACLPSDFMDEAEPILSTNAGYVQGIDDEELMQTARDHDLVFRLQHRPGDFTREGDTIALAWPADRVENAVRVKVRIAYAWGRSRTPMQDARFLVNELVEIASRALSPGVNDTFTAQSCLDWLGNALLALGKREFPSCRRFDEEGHLRVLAPHPTWSEFVGLAFSQLRPYLSHDRNVTIHALNILADLTQGLPEERHEALRLEAAALLASAESTIRSTPDLEDVRRAYEEQPGLSPKVTR